MFTAMVIVAHATDAAVFCGGTLAKLAAQGWRLVLVRVTDDAKDAVGLSAEEARIRNRAELETAAKILGIGEIVDLNMHGDALLEEPITRLREQVVYLIRKHKPYAVFTFDPQNPREYIQEHRVIAQAAESALWASGYDTYYPEQFDEGLEPFVVCERWYFARYPEDATYAEDITDYIGQKIAALCAQRTIAQSIMRYYQLQLRTWGKQAALLDKALVSDLTTLVSMHIQRRAEVVAETLDLGFNRLGEAFRLERFEELENLFQQIATPLPGAPLPPWRPGLDRDV